MKRTFPVTAFDSVQAPKPLRFIMASIFKFADLTGCWRLPRKNGATDSKEMTLLDKMYWGYKCHRPVLHPEPGPYDLTYFDDNNKKNISLPSGFQKKSSFTLGAVGDLIRTDALENSKDILYEKVHSFIFDKDISFANLESQLTTQPVKEEIFSDKETPSEHGTKAQFDTVKGHLNKRYAVLNTACNHTFDMGLEGIETTLKQLDEEKIIAIGTNRNTIEKEQGRILEVKGFKVGFVSCTFSLNNRPVPPGEEYRVNVAHLLPKKGRPDLSLLLKQINHCKSQGCDIIIASVHWGFEFEFYPRNRQIEAAHELVEAGADMLICHHPHVVQPVEYYQTKRDKDRVALIAYSMGTLTWSFSEPYLVLSLILNLTLAKGLIRGEEKTLIEQCHVIPVFRSRSVQNGPPVLKIEKLDDCLTGQEDDETKAYVAEIREIATRIFGDKIKA